jgi:hypothetical protein
MAPMNYEQWPVAKVKKIFTKHSPSSWANDVCLTFSFKVQAGLIWVSLPPFQNQRIEATLFYPYTTTTTVAINNNVMNSRCICCLMLKMIHWVKYSNAHTDFKQLQFRKNTFPSRRGVAHEKYNTVVACFAASFSKPCMGWRIVPILPSTYMLRLAAPSPCFKTRGIIAARDAKILSSTQRSNFRHNHLHLFDMSYEDCCITQPFVSSFSVRDLELAFFVPKVHTTSSNFPNIVPIERHRVRVVANSI